MSRGSKCGSYGIPISGPCGLFLYLKVLLTTPALPFESLSSGGYGLVICYFVPAPLTGGVRL